MPLSVTNTRRKCVLASTSIRIVLCASVLHLQVLVSVWELIPSHHLALHQFFDGTDQFGSTGCLWATGTAGQPGCRLEESERERKWKKWWKLTDRPDLDFCVGSLWGPTYVTGNPSEPYVVTGYHAGFRDDFQLCTQGPAKTQGQSLNQVSGHCEWRTLVCCMHTVYSTYILRDLSSPLLWFGSRYSTCPNKDLVCVISLIKGLIGSQLGANHRL